MCSRQLVSCSIMCLINFTLYEVSESRLSDYWINLNLPKRWRNTITDSAAKKRQISAIFTLVLPKQKKKYMHL